MDKNARVYVAGHTGLVGSALVRKLESEGFSKIITAPRSELDLREQRDTRDFFTRTAPDYVFFAAGRVGGIYPNMTYPAEFIGDNIVMQTNVINAAHATGVKKLMYIASSCAYPTQTEQPIKENAWLTGKLEPTNEPFAIAKLAGVGMCQSYARQYGDPFISIVPANLFGPNDDFHPATAHLVGQTMHLMHEAKTKGLDQIVLGGTGKPVRECMYVDDLADAALFLMRNYSSPSIINVGTGVPLTKREIAEAVQRAVGFEGTIVFDSSKPDGMMRRQLDVGKLFGMGWRPRASLDDALATTYKSYLESRAR